MTHDRKRAHSGEGQMVRIDSGTPPTDTVVIAFDWQFARVLAGYLLRASEPHGGVLQELADLLQSGNAYEKGAS